jgi:exodeoxyribonuclease-5
VLFDESFAFQESRERWLYTAVTRAAKRLTIVM